MSTRTEVAMPTNRTRLPGRAVLAASSRLVITSVVVGVVYSIFTTGSRGGGADIGSGHEVNIRLVLHPSPAIYLAIALAYIVATQLVLHGVSEETQAVRWFNRAIVVVLVIGFGSLAIADLWFFNQPLGGWPAPGHWIAPFPFGSQSVTTSPIPAP